MNCWQVPGWVTRAVAFHLHFEVTSPAIKTDLRPRGYLWIKVMRFCSLNVWDILPSHPTPSPSKKKKKSQEGTLPPPPKKKKGCRVLRVYHLLSYVFKTYSWRDIECTLYSTSISSPSLFKHTQKLNREIKGLTMSWRYVHVHFFAKDGMVVPRVCLGTVQYWWISTGLVRRCIYETTL